MYLCIRSLTHADFASWLLLTMICCTMSSKQWYITRYIAGRNHREVRGTPAIPSNDTATSSSWYSSRSIWSRLPLLYLWPFLLLTSVRCCHYSPRIKDVRTFSPARTTERAQHPSCPSPSLKTCDNVLQSARERANTFLSANVVCPSIFKSLTIRVVLWKKILLSYWKIVAIQTNDDNRTSIRNKFSTGISFLLRAWILWSSNLFFF